MKNLKEFKELIERYESITLEEIKEGRMILCKLTGFGRTDTCKLCKAAKNICEDCVFVYQTSSTCELNSNLITYYAIRYAENPEELLQAYRERAKHMKNLIK